MVEATAVATKKDVVGGGPGESEEALRFIIEVCVKGGEGFRGAEVPDEGGGVVGSRGEEGRVGVGVRLKRGDALGVCLESGDGLSSVVEEPGPCRRVRRRGPRRWARGRGRSGRCRARAR